MTNRLFLEYRDDRRGRGLIDFAKEAARRGAAVDGATPRVYVFSISTNQTKDGGEGGLFDPYRKGSAECPSLK